MSQLLKSTEEQTKILPSRHSARLKALSEEAAEIRRLHVQGLLTSEEAAERLEKLKNRHVGFLERLIDL